MNNSGTQIKITDVHPTRVSDFEVRRTGMRSGTTPELPIISGTPDEAELAGFSSAPGASFEYLLLGTVTDSERALNSFVVP